MTTKSKTTSNILLILVLIGLGIGGWLASTTVVERDTFVPSARTVGDEPDTNDTQQIIDLIPTDNLQIPSTIDTAFLAYVRVGSAGDVRVYSSYLDQPAEGGVYRAWAIDDDARSIEICQLQTSDGFQYRCDAEAGVLNTAASPWRYIITQQPAGLLLPGTQYLEELRT